MLEVFVEVVLFLILFYCLTLATVNEDDKLMLDRKLERIRKRAKKKKNSEISSSKSYCTEELYSKHSDYATIKRQKRPWIFSCENPLKDFWDTEESDTKRGVYQKFKEFPFMNLNNKIRKYENCNDPNCFIDKSIGTLDKEILEKTTNTDINKIINSGTQTSQHIKRNLNKKKHREKTLGDRKVNEDESLVTLTPSFHKKLERQLTSLIHTYWDHYILERTKSNPTNSTSQIVNSKSFSQSDISSYSDKLESVKSDKNPKGIWSNLLETVTMMDCNQLEDSSLSFHTFEETDKEESVLGEDLQSSKTVGQRPSKLRQIKSIKGLLKKELNEILSTDTSRNTTSKEKSLKRPDSSNVCISQRVEVKTSLNKSIQRLLEHRLSQMDHQNYKSQDQGLLRSTSYQALVDNLQFIANFIQKNCSTHNEPLTRNALDGFECFEALNVSKSRFLLNRQLVNALRSKVSNRLENNKTTEDAQVVGGQNELGETQNSKNVFN